MKAQIKVLLIVLTISLNSVEYAVSATKTWSGNSNSDWNNSGNWVGGIIADSSDNVVINSNAPNNLILTQNQKITNLTINGDTLDLGGYTLTITGTAYFNGGLVTNGLLKPTGSLCHFGGATFDARIEATCGYFHMNSGVYKKPVFLTSTGAATSSSTYGNHFEDSLTITNNGAVYFNMGSSGEDIYDGPVILYNYSSKEIRLAATDTSYFNNHVTVNASSGGVEFGASGGVSILASGKTISVGDSGFISNYLTLSNIIQLGIASINLELSGSAVVSLENCTFRGELNISAPGILTKSGIYYGNTTLNRTGSATNFHSYGNNLFAGNLTVNNSGSAGRIRFASTAADSYFGNATFNSTGGQDVQIAYSGNNIFKGNITINSNKVVFNTSDGKISFTDTLDQILNGSYNFALANMTLNKTTGSVSANTTISVDDSLIFLQGNLVTSSTNLLTMKHGSIAYGASNSSYVSGPMKKAGNQAFEFPIGKDSILRKLAISAPSNITDAFIAEYFNGSQNLGDSLDTVIVAVNHCNYWSFNRVSGNSNVNLTLPWDTSFCTLFDTTDLRFARWDSTSWRNTGHGSITGNSYSGKMTVNSISAFGYFTFGTISAAPSCSTSTFTWNNINSSSIGNTFSLAPGQSLAILGTLTITSDFILTNCQNIIMGSDARIIIQPGNQLSIYNSKITPCNNYQWDYIKITGNTAKLIIGQTHIEGADTAIWSNDGGYFSIAKQTYINRCYKGIMVDSHSSSHLGNIQSTWIGCATVAGGTNSSNLYPPHASIRTSKGIQVSNVTSITLGKNAAAPSDDVSFYNCDNGIDAQNSSITIRNCNFDKIDNNGVAIKLLASSGTHSLNVGNTIANSCNITNSTFGVIADNCNATINYNLFSDVSYGIRFTNSTNKTLTSDYNQLTYFLIGIGIYSKFKATVNIRFNNFNAPNGSWVPVNTNKYGKCGIEVHNAISLSSIVSITNNSITNCNKGISVRNIVLNSTSSSIIDNIIYFPISTSQLSGLSNFIHHGIQSFNCNKQYLRFNNITRPNYTNTSNGLEWKQFYGIQCSFLHNADLCSNLFENISSAVNYLDDCTFSYSRSNEMNECFRGFDVGVAELISGVWSGSFAAISNQFPFKYDEWNANPMNDAYTNRVYGRSATQIRWYNYTGTNATSVFFPVVTNTENIFNTNTTQIGNTCPGYLTENYERDELLGSIVTDTLTYIDFPVERRYYSFDRAYRELATDTTRLRMDTATDTLYMEFYNTYHHSNFAKFLHIEKLIDEAEFDIAEDSLEAIVDTNTYESNRKIVLEFYLTKIIKEIALSGQDSSDLMEIAIQCPMLGGPAVWEARAILNTDTINNCDSDGYRFFTQNTNNQLYGQNDIMVYPNPAHDFVKIKLPNSALTNIEFTLRDIQGRSLFHKEIRGSHISETIKLGNLVQGLYIYELKSKNNIIKTGKLIINN